ncbi:MAG TPA: hypothetical protein VEW95_05370 [Candidatus Limnocylindrales bacterium]|nr:hypothetical protein [Candidatus Limnocylindrales bacterium]
MALVAGCSAEPVATEEPAETDTSGFSACERQIRRAAEVDQMHDTVTDLDGAILVCHSLADLERASDMHPAAFDGHSVRDFITTRCNAEPDFQPGPVCQAVMP